MLAEIMMARVDDRWRAQGIAMGDGAPGEGGGRCEACLLAGTPSSPDEPVRGGRRAAGGLPEPASELPTPPASLTTTCRWQTARGLASPASCMTLAFFRRYLLARPALPARSPAIYAHASARPCGAPAPALPMLPGLHPPVHPGCCARAVPPTPASLALALALAPGPFPRLRALTSPRARLSSSSAAAAYLQPTSHAPRPRLPRPCSPPPSVDYAWARTGLGVARCSSPPLHLQPSLRAPRPRQVRPPPCFACSRMATRRAGHSRWPAP